VAIAITAEAVPLHEDAHGVVRVSGTRVTLDSVIAVFKAGATAEEIVQQYPTLPLADVYAVIAYYLKHTDEVEAYLKKRHRFAEKIRRENEKRFDPQGIRQRLLSRKKLQGK